MIGEELPGDIKEEEKDFSISAFVFRIFKYTLLFLLFYGIFMIVTVGVLENFFQNFIESNQDNVFLIWIIRKLPILLSLLAVVYLSLRKKILNKEKIEFKKDVLNKKNIITFTGAGALSLFIIFIVIPSIVFMFLLYCIATQGCSFLN